MFMHNKRLQYTVRVSETNPGLANLMLEQFGGPQGELAAAMRYFTQALAEDDPGRKDLLLDIATEELSHLEVIGTIVAMLNKGAKGKLAEGIEEQAEMYRSITGAGNDSHVTQVLYGGGPPLINSAGVPWTAAYIDSIGDPTCDLRSNIAAESRAIEPNFPTGKLPGDPRFADKYYNMSQGTADALGPWNDGEQWERVDDREQQLAVDGGPGDAMVGLNAKEEAAVMALAARTRSDATINPVTGADLGARDAKAGTTTGGATTPSGKGRVRE